jgi:hypothetical protein
LSEDFRDRPTHVGIVVDQRHVQSLREHQGRADLEHGVRGHIEEELRMTPVWSGTPEVPLAVDVECYAGYRGEETPRRFGLAAARIEIAEVVDRWLAPDHRYFKVRDGPGDLYILRNDVASKRWELTFFRRRANGAEASSPPTD